MSKSKVEALLDNETLPLTQKHTAELFGVKVPAVSKHLKNIFESNELEEKSVISILETTAKDGKNYQTNYYNLDAVISVGYRVNSTQATQFRIWATDLIKEYIIKGFAMDDERLKNGRYFGKDYFGRIREKLINKLTHWFPFSCVGNHIVPEFIHRMHSHAGAWERGKAFLKLQKNKGEANE